MRVLFRSRRKWFTLGLKGGLLFFCLWIFLAPSNRSIAATYQGDSFLIDSQPAHAVPSYQLALRLNPTSWRAQVRLAYALELLDRKQSALEGYARSLELAPMEPEVIVRAAHLYSEVGLYQQTHDILRRLLSVDPSNREALGLLSRVAALQGQFVLAEKWLLKILEYNPHAYLTHFQLAQIQQNLDREKALKSCRQVLQNGPSPEIRRQTLLLLADIHLARKEQQESIKALQTLLKYYPGSPEAEIAKVRLGSQ